MSLPTGFFSEKGFTGYSGSVRPARFLLTIFVQAEYTGPSFSGIGFYLPEKIIESGM